MTEHNKRFVEAYTGKHEARDIALMRNILSGLSDASNYATRLNPDAQREQVSAQFTLDCNGKHGLLKFGLPEIERALRKTAPLFRDMHTRPLAHAVAEQAGTASFNVTIYFPEAIDPAKIAADFAAAIPATQQTGHAL